MFCGLSAGQTSDVIYQLWPLRHTGIPWNSKFLLHWLAWVDRETAIAYGRGLKQQGEQLDQQHHQILVPIVATASRSPAAPHYVMVAGNNR